MGTMRFTLPTSLAPELVREVRRAYIAGGPDNFPLPTETAVEDDELIVRRPVDESGYLVVPWEMERLGRVLATSGTLMERPQPYPLVLELARGKLHQLRTQVAEGADRGRLRLPGVLAQRISDLTRAFSRLVTQAATPRVEARTASLLRATYLTAEQLVLLQADQCWNARGQRSLSTSPLLGCRLGPSLLTDDVARAVVGSFNAVSLPMCWKEVAPTEGSHSWDATDAQLDWALSQGLVVTAGPLIDFSANRLPDWLWLWERDLGSIASFMDDYVRGALDRYADRIQTWQITAASNSGRILQLGEDECEFLTARLVEEARKAHPELKFVVGIAQPWGDYMADSDCAYSPLVFAETLIRSGLDLAAVDLEIICGVRPRGSYSRDLLELCRLLGLYRLLRVPLRVTIGYPAAPAPDPAADPDLTTDGGYWHGGLSPTAQAQWAAAFTDAALAEDAVQAVHWVQLSDADPHLFPHCGLFDAAGHARPVLEQLAALRQLRLA